MRTHFWAAAACALVAVTPALARPYTVRDALRLEGFGASSVDPSGRWLIQERQARYDSAPRFDNDINLRPILTRLLRVDLRHPSWGVAAFPQTKGAGYIAGPFSPSGKYMVVYRDRPQRWDIGVVTIASRRVRWLGFGADFADFGDTLAWRSDDELIALALPSGDRYYKERLALSAMRQLPNLWARQRRGRVSTLSAVGSGAFIDIHPPYANRRVVSVDSATGRITELARGAFQRLALPPAGDHLALVETAGRVPLKPDELISQATQYERTRLRILDLRARRLAAPCGEREVLANSLRWSTAGDRLLAVLRRGDTSWEMAQPTLISPGRTCDELQLGVLKPTLTLAGGSAAATAHLEWLGRSPIVLANAPGGPRQDWFALGDGTPKNLTRTLPASPGDPLAVTSDHALFAVGRTLYSVDGDGTSTPLTGLSFDRILASRRPNMSAPLPPEGPAQGKNFSILSDRASGSRLWVVSAERASPVLSVPRGLTALAAFPGGLVAREADAQGVDRLRILDRSGGSVVVSEINAELRDVDFTAPREIDHLGPNGEPLKSWLYLPVPAADRTLPALVVMAYPSAVYATPPYSGRPGQFLSVDDNVQLAVAHGFAVLVPSLPITAGSTNPGAGWDQAILALVEHIAAQGAVDPARVAFWGHSFGGYVGLMLAAQTHCFAAIIAAAAPTDLISFRGEGFPGAWLNPEDMQAAQGWAGWGELGIQGHMLSTPWSNSSRYIENSPAYLADRMGTPILLVQGDQDPVSLSQGREMFSDLYRLNKDALFLTYYGEAHSILSPANYRAYAQQTYRFLDTYLSPESESPQKRMSRISSPQGGERRRP